MDDLAYILASLTSLYGKETGQDAFFRLTSLLESYRDRFPAPHAVRARQAEAILITYGDQVRQPGVKPLQTLADFCSKYLSGVVSSIHILPFYPYSSDDGFSVIDYSAVDPALGSWDEIACLRRDFQLMFDAVINHISVRSTWFQGFLNGEQRYRDYFITVPDGTDLSQVVRPRTLPLLTPFLVAGEKRHIWTTFSTDQVDLNYHNPNVLLDILDVLLTYVSRGAELIRLDAIAYLWKEFGSTCLHLPQTHQIIQLMRAVLDLVAPHVRIVTETNVPHTENLSYFGDGRNEAQMVYNFALPPLVLHTFHSGSAETLSRWAGSLRLPSPQVTFFNFLASHDGIGLNPAGGILTPAEIDALVQRTQAHGGLVSYKNNPDGSTSPYELNINYFDALSNPAGDETLPSVAIKVDRFIASQAVMLSLVGVPGIYFHSLFGSRGWQAGVQQTRQNRTINRQKFSLEELDRELSDPLSLRSRVFQRYTHLLRTRSSHPAFDPFGEMSVLDAGARVFAVLRLGKSGRPVLCLQNISRQPQRIGLEVISILKADTGKVIDLVSGENVGDISVVSLAPYQTLWLTYT